MMAPGRILIADDEELCLNSMADMLREVGYECSCAPDGATAARMVRDGAYDLLISDINMPGNTQLEFVRGVQEQADDLPVVLITAYPTVDSAVESFHLAVAAYLVKPVRMQELVETARGAIERARLRHAVRVAGRSAERWREGLAQFEAALNTTRRTPGPTPIDSFTALSIQNIVENLLDLKNITQALASGRRDQEACHLMNCPRLQALTRTVEDAIKVLEATKGSFKSRELGALRRKLQAILEH